MAKLEDLDLDPAPKDDRWTITKLMQAGYQEEWTRTCRTCGDQIAGWKHQTTGRTLVLNDPVLDPHQC